MRTLIVGHGVVGTNLGAELSALIRICGTLSFHGNGRYTLRVQTETGSVARSLMQLIHNTLGLETALTVRRSVQRKSNNYLIEIAKAWDLTSDQKKELSARGLPRRRLRSRPQR